jgi:hypothetical protein
MTKVLSLVCLFYSLLKIAALTGTGNVTSIMFLGNVFVKQAPYIRSSWNFPSKGNFHQGFIWSIGFSLFIGRILFQCYDIHNIHIHQSIFLSTNRTGNRYRWADLLYLFKLNYSTYFDVSNLILSSLLLFSQFHSDPLFSCSPPAAQTTSSYPAVRCYRERHDTGTPGGRKG